MTDPVEKFLFVAMPEPLLDSAERFAAIRRRVIRRRMAGAGAVALFILTATGAVLGYAESSRVHTNVIMPSFSTSCGGLAPSSTGADTDRVLIVLTVPRLVATGETATGRVSVAATVGEVTFASSQPIEVLLVRNGIVVGGGYFGSLITGTGMTVRASVRSPFVVPARLPIRACPGNPESVAGVNKRAQMQPGEYQAIAVVDDHPIGRPDGAASYVVSKPVWIKVVASR